MPGRGRAPKPPEDRRTRHRPQRGEYQSAPGVGWQHGLIPEPPGDLVAASQAAWETWMRSWVASHWTPLDLPGLRHVARFYDQIERGHFVRATELRMWS